MNIWYHTHQLPKTFTHHHTAFEIMYCVEGSYLFHYKNALGEKIQKEVSPKTMVFIPKNMQHGVEEVVYPYKRYFLQLPAHQSIELLENSFLLSPFHNYTMQEGKKSFVPNMLDAASSSDIIEAILERMLNVSIRPDIENSSSELHMNCLLELLFCELNEKHCDFFSTPQTAKSHIVNEVRMYIDKNYDQHFTISDLANQHFIHPTYLSRLFSKQIGLSPRQYLTNLRLANSRKLLISTEDTVQSISLQVGFSDVNNFIQCFRKMFGTTPKQYKKKIFTEIMG